MADLKTKEKLRTAHRNVAMEILVEAKESVEKEIEDLPPMKLETTRIQLYETLATVTKLDREIQELMAEKDGPDIDKEILDSHKKNQDMHAMLVAIDQKLGTGSKKLESKSEVKLKKMVKPRLPKIQPRKFNGDPKNWLEFWDSFKGTIHENEDLSERDKFDYLKSLLEGTARSAVAGFTLTEVNYKEAIKLLTDRFGREEDISHSHYEELMKLQPVFSDKDMTRIRKLYDDVETHHRALKALGKAQDQYSDVFVPLIESKLPENLRVSLLMKKSGPWKMDEMLDILGKEIKIREMGKPLSKPKSGYVDEKEHKKSKNLNTTSALFMRKDSGLCAFCLGKHAHEDCRKVSNLDERKRIIRKFGRCFICLQKGHRAAECRKTYKCKNCRESHHTSICNNEQQEQDVNESDGSGVVVGISHDSGNGEPPVVESSGLHVRNGGSIALQTAQAILRIKNGKQPVKCRVMFDSGSQRSFVTTAIVKLLGGKPMEKEWMRINGFGVTEPKGKLCNILELCVSPVNGGESVKVNACEVPFISKGLENYHVETMKFEFPHLEKLWFSDITQKKSLEIDMLIGADHLWQFQNGNIVRGKPDEPVAVETKLGYVLSGPLKGVATGEVHVNLMMQNKNVEIENNLRKLWDLETLGIREKDVIHENLLETIEYTGKRYRVKLPWKVGHPPLPSNYGNALSRLRSQVRRLEKEPEVLREYDHIIKDQLEKGIVEKVPDQEVKAGKIVHYLPHQAVVRKSAETTKVRMVFDASSKESRRGVSLNDCLHVGPPLAPLLFDVLLRLRTYKVVLIGDIQQAFLNIEVAKEDRDAMRFLWYSDICTRDGIIDVYRFCRVIFGAGPSPFLLNGTLRHHIEKYEKEDPEFVRKLVESFYVDDLATGSHSECDAFHLHQKIKSRMAEGGFVLRKWKSNSQKLVAMIEKAENSAPQASEDFTYAQTTLGNLMGKGDKILGVSWDRENDVFSFPLEELVKRSKVEKITKRVVLSVISSLFDPMGIISPVMVNAKILFQDICQLKIGWDTELPQELKIRWQKWISDLDRCQTITIRRCLYGQLEEEVIECHLHGFGDASKRAYCAVLYLVTHQVSGIYVQLLTSKTRVAPLKEMTIPRLELTSARILAQLTQTVHGALEHQVKLASTNLWLDSMTALYWIENRKEWKQFVQHRVNEILTQTSKDQWKHVPGKENPADLGTRGADPSQLKNSKLWWFGPAWLTKDEKEWPVKFQIEETPESMIEAKQSVNVLVISQEEIGLSKIIDYTRFGKWQKLKRSVAYLFRFVHNVTAKKNGKQMQTGRLTMDELRSAEHKLLESAQSEVEKSPNYKQLVLTLGLVKQDGLIRCTGRLGRSDLEESAKKPILLPKDHWLTHLLIQKAHQSVLHGGVRETLAEVRSHYWICQGRQQVKKFAQKCVTCRKFQGRPYPAPVTAELPEFRVTESRPFSKTGVDFAGPIYIKTGKSQMRKVYLCLYTCAVTRALHLELADDLTANCFIQCFRRFSARRGRPQLIISDNAKTFKAASKWIKKLIANEDVQRYLEDNGVKWQFNLERAPWWGGFFERLVGSVKRCLRKVVGNARLSRVELETILVEIEGTLNNRPLTYSYDELGEDMLTPAHLLYGYRFETIPDDVKDEEDDANLNKRVRYLANRRKHFWRRWRREYLVDLREMHKLKATKKGDQIKQQDVVIVFEEGLPRGKWRLGRVNKVIPGKDGLIRGAQISVSNRNGGKVDLYRPLQKLYPLEVSAMTKTQNEPKEVQAAKPPRRAAAIDADWRRHMMDQMN